ncbi:hypothetical protein ACJ41P_31825 [Azospirillum argentinense]|uniref:Restriction endonuclease n=1 Tax=Azospirillum argentinense TaxID=2970906 RepID=A0ABW8VKQ0_9PROT
MRVDYKVSKEAVGPMVIYCQYLRDMLKTIGRREAGRQYLPLPGSPEGLGGVYVLTDSSKESGRAIIVSFAFPNGKSLTAAWGNARVTGRINIEKASLEMAIDGPDGMWLGLRGDPDMDQDVMRIVAASLTHTLTKAADHMKKVVGKTTALHSVMGDFVTAALKGEILDSLELYNAGLIKGRKAFRPDLNTGAPVFDFGKFLLYEAKFTGRDLQEFATDDRLTLPYPECFFIMTEVNGSEGDDILASDVVIYLVATSNGTAMGRVFTRFQEHRHLWCEEFVTLHWGEGVSYRIKNIPGAAERLGKLAEIYARQFRMWIGGAAWLLNLPRETRDRVIREEWQEVQVRKSLTLGKSGRRPSGVTVIHCDRGELADVIGKADETGSHSPKSPHHRRGHFRRLRDGRVIPVRPCHIHGGATTQKIYEVRE